jgi:hypothetical protein
MRYGSGHFLSKNYYHEYHIEPFTRKNNILTVFIIFGSA